MPTPISNLTTLHAYTLPALRRALCHAPNVADILPHVIGCVVLFADPASLTGRGNGGTQGGNMGWISSAATGRRFAVVYHHTRDCIEIRDQNQQGRVLHSFTIATPNRVITAAFMAL